ncbi:HlyC/CorC family transporter [Agathobacter ruminis]|uniref:Hemolysin n=1 Tax=Agathobacter ruminis TaxID=1712665 RepID=A0A2G3E6K6_9FIRM|nr:hemolysin family protein [Agathobacter ruminis]MDC7300921.1 hemolysin family protein [Agathobacter ruminis]PHU38874.1 hemolysin [Agathobacter ruminis]
MDSTSVIQLISLVILMLLSAFFSSAETALTTVNKVRMRTMAEDGNRRAARVVKLIEKQTRLLSAILIGNNLVNITMTAVATVFATDLLGSAGAGVATGLLTLLVLIFGEISPKNIAAIHSEKISLIYSGPISAWLVICTPISFVINMIARFFMFLLRVNPDQKQESFTEDEIRSIVEESHEDGVIESEEKKMINNVFDLDDHYAKDVMVPRADMVFLSVDSNYRETLDVYRNNMFTRMPVYEGDHDNIIGMVNMRDLLLYEDIDTFDIHNILREAVFTHEHKKTSELMAEMRENSIAMEFVLDEYGSVAGLVTLEDLLEEIVGEIRDEYDEEEKNQIRRISDREYIVEGSMKLEDLQDQIGLDIESEDYDSIGGVIIGLLDHLPEAGEQVETDNHIVLVVEAVEKNRIDSVHIYLPESSTPEEVEPSEDKDI